MNQNTLSVTNPTETKQIPVNIWNKINQTTIDFACIYVVFCIKTPNVSLNVGVMGLHTLLRRKHDSIV
jgi:hypothetical protein